MENQSQDHLDTLDDKPQILSAFVASYTVDGKITIENIYVQNDADSISSLAAIYKQLRNYELIKTGVESLLEKMDKDSIKTFINSMNTLNSLSDPMLCPTENNLLKNTNK